MQSRDEKESVRPSDDGKSPISEVDDPMVSALPGYQTPAHHLDISKELYQRRWITGARVRMAVLLVAGAAMMVVHDRFYTFLAGRPVADSTQSPFVNVLHASLSDQTIANAVGNLIANVSRAVFGGAIGVAFVQIFWRHMRGRGLTIAQMDTAMTCKEHPFDPTTWSAIFNTFWLALMAFLAALMAIITIVTPGSLSVASIPVNGPCTVPVANLSDTSLSGYSTLVNETTGEAVAFLYRNPNARATRFVTQVLMSGSYVPPSSPCGFCEYNVSFVAPALQCANITNQVSELFPEALPVPPSETNDTDVNIMVWNAIYGVRNASGLGMEVFTRTLKPRTNLNQSSVLIPGDNEEAVLCFAYSATYHTFVQHNLTSTITVLDVEMGEAITVSVTNTTQATEPIGLADATLLVLNGTVTYEVDTFAFTSGSSAVAYSPLGGSSEDLAWTWQPGGSTDLVFSLPSLMQNISLSLLSGAAGEQAFQGLSNIDTECAFTGLHYVYDRNRLLVTYGVALLVTCISVAFGFRAVLEAKVDETISFSRLLVSLLNEELYNMNGRKELRRSTMVRAHGDPHGQMRPV